MADITKATVPITNRNIIQPHKENRDTNEIPFDFQDTSKVKQTTQSSDLPNDRNVLRQDGATTGFYEILHDNQVSSLFLKNIFLLRQIVDILPMNNNAQTEEIKQLFDNLMLKPEEIPGELMRQEDISTIFKGGFFDILRNLISENAVKNAENPSQVSEFETAVANLLKAINSESSKEDVLKSVMNDLTFLKGQIQASPKLSAEMDNIIQSFRNFAQNVVGVKLSQPQEQTGQTEQNVENNVQPQQTNQGQNVQTSQNAQNTQNPQQSFSQLKSEIFKAFGDMESSILFSDEIARTMSMTNYNLSRLNLSDEGVAENFAKLLSLIESDTDKENLTNSLLKFLDDNAQASDSKTMNALTEILQKQSENPDIKMVSSDSINRIVQSLLSSPCNFTPLLHYVIPVEYEDVQASAEMWINPDGEEDMTEAESKGKKYTHMLVVFDIEDIGKFEAELFVQEKNIDLSVYCPKEYTDFYKTAMKNLRRDLDFSEYKLKKLNVETLEEPRSLIEVFKSLPARRLGVNVKI